MHNANMSSFAVLQWAQGLAATITLLFVFYFLFVGAVGYPYLAIQASGAWNLAPILCAIVLVTLAVRSLTRQQPFLQHRLLAWVNSVDNHAWYAGALLVLLCHVFTLGILFQIDPFATDTALVTATRLLRDGVYDVPGEYYLSSTQAFYPPGRYFYAGIFSVILGEQRWVVVVAHLALVLSLLYYLRKLALLVANEAVAKLTVLFVALWPNYLSGVYSIRKEMLAATLFIISLYYFVRWLRHDGQSMLPALFCGAALGGLTLTQPSMMFAPIVLFGYDLLRKKMTRRRLSGHFVIVVGMLLLISPWTYRNYQVFGRFILVTNNFGYVLYVGNNPQTIGVWGRFDFFEDFEAKGYDELSGEEAAKDAAMQWIADNPAQFAALIPQKHIHLMAQDATNVLWLARAADAEASVRYKLLNISANLYWVLILTLAMAATASIIRRGAQYRDPLIVSLLIFLYTAAIHSIVESGDRHHLIFVPIFFLIIARWLLDDELSEKSR